MMHCEAQLSSLCLCNVFLKEGNEGKRLNPRQTSCSKGRESHVTQIVSFAGGHSRSEVLICVENAICKCQMREM